MDDSFIQIAIAAGAVGLLSGLVGISEATAVFGEDADSIFESLQIQLTAKTSDARRKRKRDCGYAFVIGTVAAVLLAAAARLSLEKLGVALTFGGGRGPAFVFSLSLLPLSEAIGAAPRLPGGIFDLIAGLFRGTQVNASIEKTIQGGSALGRGLLFASLTAVSMAYSLLPDHSFQKRETSRPPTPVEIATNYFGACDGRAVELSLRTAPSPDGLHINGTAHVATGKPVDVRGVYSPDTGSLSLPIREAALVLERAGRLKGGQVVLFGRSEATRTPCELRSWRRGPS